MQTRGGQSPTLTHCRAYGMQARVHMLTPDSVQCPGCRVGMGQSHSLTSPSPLAQHVCPSS